MTEPLTDRFSGRCYCGALSLSIDAPPLCVVYCHCRDCRRWTGSPLPCFAAFAEGALTAQPPFGRPLENVPGVRRWTCGVCGSPMAALFDYIPGQIYVPLGVLDQADLLLPQQHCHANEQMPWLHLEDGLPRIDTSGRNELNDYNDYTGIP